MKINKNILKINENLWNLWKSSEIYGNRWKTVKIYRNPCKSMKINIFLLFLLYSRSSALRPASISSRFSDFRLCSGPLGPFSFGPDWIVIEFAAGITSMYRILFRKWVPDFWQNHFQHFRQKLNFYPVMTVGSFQVFIKRVTLTCVLQVKVHVFPKTSIFILSV